MRLPALATIASAAAVAVLAPSTAYANTYDGAFVHDTNAARSHYRLHGYVVSSTLTAEARRWAQHMARTHTLAHNPHAPYQSGNWRALGENVGVGSSVGQIQRAFMNSSPHRSNILSHTYTQVGIGTARGSDGRLYVDEVFRRP